MQIETAAAIEAPKGKKQNESSFADQMRSYLRHPGSMILMFLVMLATFITFALLLFLIFYTNWFTAGS